MNNEAKLYELTDAEIAIIWAALLAYNGIDKGDEELLENLIKKFEE